MSDQWGPRLAPPAMIHSGLAGISSQTHPWKSSPYLYGMSTKEQVQEDRYLKDKSCRCWVILLHVHLQTDS